MTRTKEPFEEIWVAFIFGEDELKNGTIWVKDLESKEEKTVLLEEF